MLLIITVHLHVYIVCHDCDSDDQIITVTDCDQYHNMYSDDHDRDNDNHDHHSD